MLVVVNVHCDDCLSPGKPFVRLPPPHKKIDFYNTTLEHRIETINIYIFYKGTYLKEFGE